MKVDIEEFVNGRVASYGLQHERVVECVFIGLVSCIGSKLRYMFIY